MNIIFSSISAPFFAKYLADITKKKYVRWQQVPLYRKNKTCLFLVGLYFPRHQFYNRISHFKRITILFAGSDILRLNDEMSKKERNKLFNKLKNDGAIYATESPEIRDKIKKIYNLDTEIIYLPSKHIFPKYPMPMPDKFSIGCYMPNTSKKMFYGYKVIMEVIKELKDVDFYFYGLDGYDINDEEKKIKNIKCIKEPVSNMSAFLRNISCGLRITDHDTYSMSAIEYNMAGRWFINNHPMPHCDKVHHKPKVKDVVDLIKNIIKRDALNLKGKELYDLNHSWNNFDKTIRKFI